MKNKNRRPSPQQVFDYNLRALRQTLRERGVADVQRMSYPQMLFRLAKLVADEVRKGSVSN